MKVPLRGVPEPPLPTRTWMELGMGYMYRGWVIWMEWGIWVGAGDMDGGGGY